MAAYPSGLQGVLHGRWHRVIAIAAMLTIASVSPGLAQTVAAAGSSPDTTNSGDIPFGDYQRAMVAHMESIVARIGILGTQWIDPVTGEVTEVEYTASKATQIQKRRTFDAMGHSKDVELGRQTFASADGGANGTAQIGLDTAATKVSAHPPKAYFDKLTAIDQAMQVKKSQAHVNNDGGILAQLGIVGRAEASLIGPNSMATGYDNNQNYSDLGFSWAVYWYDAPGQHQLHSAYLQSNGEWDGNGTGNSDPGGRDVIDVEYDPSVMYLNGVVWSPGVDNPNFPWTLHPACGGQQRPLNMDSSMGNAWWGAYTQQPSHCAKYNTLQLDIRPKSSASFNVNFNVYFNFTHTWNYYNPGPISVSASFGFLSVGPGALGGEWNKNIWKTLTC
jgi:hypothetical protein